MVFLLILIYFKSIFYVKTRNTKRIQEPVHYIGWIYNMKIKFYIYLYIYIYIYIYIYCHQNTDSFVVSQLFSMARHGGRLKLGSKPTQLYV